VASAEQMSIRALILYGLAALSVAHAGTRPWTVKDIVEVSEISSVALTEDGATAAYVLKQGTVDDNTVHYALYRLDTQSKQVRKLLDASHIENVSRDEQSGRWTALVDRGQGTQLYAISDDGQVSDLIVNVETSLVGAYDGWIHRALDGPQPMGVMSYQWSPDGRTFWYSRARLVSPTVEAARRNGGIVYDDTTMTEHSISRLERPLAAIELHLFDPAARADHLIAAAPSEELNNEILFRSEYGTTVWSPDSRTIRYLAPGSENQQTEVRAPTPWVFDVGTGRTHQLHGDSIEANYETVPVDASTAVMIDRHGDKSKLVEVSIPGGQQRELGVVDYLRFSEGRVLWKDPKNKRLILAVHWPDHDGLTTWPQSAVSRALAKSNDFLDHCAAAVKAEMAICVRQTLVLAPEIVSVSLSSGAVHVLARPNSRYDDIAPLTSKPQQWINHYGSVSDGYITWPRNFDPHQKYPVIAVTHGHDAQNRFLESGFQWEFPVQVWAERGYLVLSVNDPRASAKTWAAHEGFSASGPKVDVEAQQFAHGFDAIAGMEAALQSVIDQGLADAEKTGVAGYSRGSEVVELVMTHSSLYKVASDGDAGGWNAGVYWAVGATEYQELYKRLYGGSPYDPAVEDNYRRYSPTMRAKYFAGPLLQQFTAANGPLGLELHTLLRDEHIPTELVTFQHESHLFWQPAHRASAMERNLAWFDYWLRDKRSDTDVRAIEYEHWDAMKKAWLSRSDPTASMTK
jgi:dipeptidyl aminopeptidase/acylaminoacyl peptidase